LLYSGLFHPDHCNHHAKNQVEFMALKNKILENFLLLSGRIKTLSFDQMVEFIDQLVDKKMSIVY